MNNSDKVYLTKEGLEKIQKELEQLKSKTRPETVDRLSLARIQGDLSENNEYTSAKEDLAFIDSRIEELEELLLRVVLIDEKQDYDGMVSLGCRVTVNLENDEHLYHIVGEWEADPVQKKVSHSSPLGQALIGRKVGDEVEFEAPAGKVLYKIVKIE